MCTQDAEKDYQERLKRVKQAKKAERERVAALMALLKAQRRDDLTVSRPATVRHPPRPRRPRQGRLVTLAAPRLVKPR